MIEIPRFSASQLEDIVPLFGEEGVPFDYKGITTSISRYGGVSEYILVVEDENLELAVELLMDFFGITPEVDQPFVGPCPACNTEIKDEVECPECGLSLCVAIPAEFKKHPFYLWLSLNGRLPNR